MYFVISNGFERYKKVIHVVLVLVGTGLTDDQRSASCEISLLTQSGLLYCPNVDVSDCPESDA